MKRKPLLAHRNSIKETQHLMRSPANAAHLAKSIAELRAGTGKERELDTVACRYHYGDK
ncbi:hypothetical protein LG198_04895 [Methylobacillus arboreus]|uniref:hypothetical protein n=1 Tax=Methylobacillus arboreus TaxID=755170 RepID=UPI001E38B336|nr:hypothetical protein [Methylobacillus arboreus]MCB5190064.1 hypothetical protein [Methylobacillus arboreus]